MYQIRVVLILLLYTTSLFSSVSLYKLKFESGISFYGKIGFVDVILKEDRQKHIYMMKVKAYSTGLVKLLSRNRKDTFISEGNIINGIYKPHKFTRISTKHDYKKVTVYQFDYKKNSVYKTVKIEEWRMKKTFNPMTLTWIKKRQLHKEEKKEKIALVPNDYLSLYLNLKQGNLKPGIIKYIDENKENKIVLLNNSLFEIEKHNGKKKYKIKLIGDNKSMFFQEAISINIAFYGDAYIRKIWERKRVL